MTSAREIMTPGAEWLDTEMSVTDAANRMATDGFGALPICDGEGHLQGVLTDRDIVLKVVAAGLDPLSTTVGQLADQPQVVTIGADDPVEEAIRTMKDHGVRRLPVIDGSKLVGMVSQADIARSVPEAKIGDLVATISEQPPNN